MKNKIIKLVNLFAVMIFLNSSVVVQPISKDKLKKIGIGVGAAAGAALLAGGIGYGLHQRSKSKQLAMQGKVSEPVVAVQRKVPSQDSSVSSVAVPLLPSSVPVAPIAPPLPAVKAVAAAPVGVSKVVEKPSELSPDAQYWMNMLNDPASLVGLQDPNLVSQERERARQREDFLKANSRKALSSEATRGALQERVATRAAKYGQ